MPNLMAALRLGRPKWASGSAWRSLGVATGALLADVSVALAATAEHAGEAEHGSGGLPQLNPDTFAPQLVWLAITFGALYYLMSRVALPRVAEVLEARQERIAHDLDKAAAVKEEAANAMAAYDKTLTDARLQAQALMAETTAQMDSEAAARQSQLVADLASRVKKAEGDISAAKEAALANIQSVAGEIAAQVASKLAGIDIDAGKASDAVAAVMKSKMKEYA